MPYAPCSDSALGSSVLWCLAWCSTGAKAPQARLRPLAGGLAFASLGLGDLFGLLGMLWRHWMSPRANKDRPGKLCNGTPSDGHAGLTLRHASWCTLQNISGSM